MNDTNLVLHLTNGQEIKVIYPLRVFFECETPWLDKPGCLQTSDPVKDFAKFKNSEGFGYAQRFVVGTWMPEYNTNENRTQTIPMSKIELIVPANREDIEQGNRIHWEEEEDRLDASYGDQTITRKLLAELFPEKAQEILVRPRKEFKKS